MMTKTKNTLRELMQERAILLDGGMGTQIFAKNPTVDDYGGLEVDGCVELLNERRREWIQEIHSNYFHAGADAVETNTFGCNEVVLSEFNLAHRTFELNLMAAQLARQVADDFHNSKYVIGSVGPGTKLVTLLQIDYQTLYKSYLAQMHGLITGNVDAILIETAQDINQVKIAIRAAKNAMKELKKEIPIWAQVTIETTGTMLVGSDIQSALTTLEMFDIDVIGLNCATGPDEMRPHVAYLAKNAASYISAIPNAGLPQNIGGQTVYPLNPKEFAAKVSKMAADFSLNVIGGCCGTTPEHIKELAILAKNLPQPISRKNNNKSIRNERNVSSLYSSVPLNLEPRPLYVGERTNANGSKKFRESLGQDNFDDLLQIAKDQLKEGAHVLDVCVAYVARNEENDMAEYLKKLITQINIPIMIDSTEVNVIERALQIAPGKCIVNSINFEDGDDKAKSILGLCKEYGAAVVALTIDEDGMAKTCEKKLKIASRIYHMAVNEFGLNPGDLIFDPLTFTLASGDQEFRKSAIETLDAIEHIKRNFPHTKTILGLSNVSFGLTPYTRQMLNSIMLYLAVKKGLDLAILNSSKIIPISRISDENRILFEDLIYDRRTEDYDPLKIILQKFSNVKSDPNEKQSKRQTKSIEEKLIFDIVDAEKQHIIDDCKEALATYPPLDIINKILLEGMKIVGTRFGSGEMQLPFVLESAEVMKSAVRFLEPLMKKDSSYSKGKIILATVKGDVHDIGKNLVEIILSNNGFQVVNLGIKQPIESILEKYKTEGADAIGMSGLLVKSTSIMKENLEYMREQGCSVPVLLGGAALTREFVENHCASAYNGPVFYAFDAFDGLKIMEKLSSSHKEIPSSQDKTRLSQIPLESSEAVVTTDNKIRIIRKGESKIELNAYGQSPWVRKNEITYTPPFFGTKIIEEPLENIFNFLDEFALIRSRWNFTQGNKSDDEFNKIINEKAYPLFKKWKEKLIFENKIRPKAIYGYFKTNSVENRIHVYDSDISFEFPRQSLGRRLCISDFIKHKNTLEADVLALQVVTMGEEFSELTNELYKQDQFSDYFYLHGIGTELTEAFAELIHKRIRTELGIADKDAKNLRQLFSQGYQGSRYSFGYPACPNMEGNEILLNLLDAKRIGVSVSETFQIYPELSTCALVCAHPQARYFSV